MAAGEDGTSPPPTMKTSDLGPSENMTGTFQLDEVRISDLHRSEDGTFDNMMQTDGGTSFLDNHGSGELLSDEGFSENTTEGDFLDQAVGDMDEHEHSSLSMAEDQNHHMSHHSHGNLSMGGTMMEHDHDEYDHAHGGRQLMMEIGILTSLVMLILALVILLALPSNR